MVDGGGKDVRNGKLTNLVIIAKLGPVAPAVLSQRQATSYFATFLFL